jgi:H/ACA ribonucleoprotein complex non-core subunit NAF1
MSSDSGSDSESDPSVNDDDAKSVSNHSFDEDDESGLVPTIGAYFQTKNEIHETDITIPDIAEVGPQELLEKVGEIMSVMENMVIVKGLPSERTNQGSERALDSDTLLVFEDRKVMGYVSIVKSSWRMFLR